MCFVSGSHRHFWLPGAEIQGKRSPFASDFISCYQLQFCRQQIYCSDLNCKRFYVWHHWKCFMHSPNSKACVELTESGVDNMVFRRPLLKQMGCVWPLLKTSVSGHAKPNGIWNNSVNWNTFFVSDRWA